MNVGDAAGMLLLMLDKLDPTSNRFYEEMKTVSVMGRVFSSLDLIVSGELQF
jgi:hypothetical protein